MDRFSKPPLAVSNENVSTEKAKTARFRVVEHAGGRGWVGGGAGCFCK